MDTPLEHIRVSGLEMRYGARVIQRGLDFAVMRGDIFVIMGGSGCGKSTLLKHMIGLYEPAAGEVFYNGTSYQRCDAPARAGMRRRWGITYQSGGLFSAMTLAENVALPLTQYTSLDAASVRARWLRRAKGDHPCLRIRKQRPPLMTAAIRSRSESSSSSK